MLILYLIRNKVFNYLILLKSGQVVLPTLWLGLQQQRCGEGGGAGGPIVTFSVYGQASTFSPFMGSPHLPALIPCGPFDLPRLCCDFL